MAEAAAARAAVAEVAEVAEEVVVAGRVSRGQLNEQSVWIILRGLCCLVSLEAAVFQEIYHCIQVEILSN